MTPQKVGFRKIDNDYFAALMAAPLTGSEYKVILSVIHQTWGYQKKSVPIKLTKFVELTGLSRWGLVKAIKRVKAKCIIDTQAATKKRGPKSTLTYTLTDHTRWQLASKVQPQLTNNATTVDYNSQLPMPRTEPVKKPLNKLLKKDNALAGINYFFKDIISYYLKTYQRHKGTAHPELKDEQWHRVVTALATFCREWDIDCESDPKDFQAMIDYHFQRKLETDYNINHFATEGILQNLFYKKVYR